MAVETNDIQCLWLALTTRTTQPFTLAARIIIIIHRFSTALFSALEQTHCAHVACDSEWVTVSFL